MATAVSPAFTSSGGAAPPNPNATPSTLPYDTDNPAIPHPAYLRMEPRWTKCRALMAGTEAIRDGGEDYLPRFESESDDSYSVRVQLAALYNGFARVVKASVGMLLQQEPVLGKDMPQPLVDLWENVDGAGTHGAVFTAQLVENGIIDGHDGIFVDYLNPDAAQLDRSRASAAATVGSPLSADDEARLGLRPYWILVKADDVIKQLYQTIDGRRTLILLVIRENIDERVGQFGVVGRTRYRVYTNERGAITYQLWTVPIGNVRPVLTEGPRPMRNMTRIPWSPLRTGQRLSEVETRPPLMDLADLNLQHHQVQTNLLNLEQLACVPTQVRIGAPVDENGNYPPITLGPRSTIEAPYQQGVTTPVYWHSPNVTVLEPARKTLEATEAAMGAMGLSFLAPQTRATETAQAKRIDATAQNASIATVGRATQDCLELAFQFTGEYVGVKAGSVSVNKEFENLVIEPQVMMAYVAAVKDAGFPPRLLVDAWKAGGRLPDDVDVDQLLLEMETNLNAAADQKALDAAAQAAALAANTGTGPQVGAA